MTPPQRVYLDTSILMALLSKEPESERVLQWLGGRQWPELLVSPWVHAELASALAVKQRMRQLSPAKARHAWEEGRALLANIPSVDITPADFDTAATLCADARARLRAPDALHLAVAARSGCQALATLDADMQKAARKLGLPPIAF
ncbi:PIN domain-containing protein [Vandammella animalimorsus]|uniref:Ribonuclease VapC n=1 Tax=Vandammella animalimorsus TaxID=2029117 RepID=A0A3M6R7F6_9BURK|nr:type II toxin-antitoxin system VapC family toxin [Vandammella animalimorsus]RMX10668.1 PIN domain-containing protein [Vandammella animalimorsus]